MAVGEIEQPGEGKNEESSAVDNDIAEASEDDVEAHGGWAGAGQPES